MKRISLISILLIFVTYKNCLCHFEVTQSKQLWYFIGEDPTNYAIVVTLTGSDPEGTYTWVITAGSDKVSLENQRQNKIDVRSEGPSNPPGNDVTIKVTHKGYTKEHKLTVYAPACAIVTGGPIDYALGYGYRTYYEMTIYDNLNNLLPLSIEGNEDHLEPWTSDYPGENWDPEGRFSFWAHGSKFADNYKFESRYGTPRTVNPGQPGWATAVKNTFQFYYAGSFVTSCGNFIKSHKLHLYRGCARQW